MGEGTKRTIGTIELKECEEKEKSKMDPPIKSENDKNKELQNYRN